MNVIFCQSFFYGLYLSEKNKKYKLGVFEITCRTYNMKKINSVDEYILEKVGYSKILIKLRKLLLSTGMEEAIKWGAPVYMYDKKNIAGMAAFKSYAGLWFYQGVLLSDPYKVLINAQEGKTNALRQWRFSSEEELDEVQILEYLKEAIDNQKKGKQIKPKRNKPLVVPDELKNALIENPELKTLFNQFSLSHKREYAEYIAEAKREETRMRRLDKVVGMIMKRKGLNDSYRK